MMALKWALMGYHLKLTDATNIPQLLSIDSDFHVTKCSGYQVLIWAGRRQWSLQYTALEEAIRKKEVLETPTRNRKQICSMASWVERALGACCLICKILSRIWKCVWWKRLPGSWQEESVQQLEHSGRNVGNCLVTVLKARKTKWHIEAGWLRCEHSNFTCCVLSIVSMSCVNGKSCRHS